MGAATGRAFDHERRVAAVPRRRFEGLAAARLSHPPACRSTIGIGRLWASGSVASQFDLRRWLLLLGRAPIRRSTPHDPAFNPARRQPRHARTSCDCTVRAPHRGLCPGCGTLLLHADHGPQSPREWEQWTRALTKALRKTSVVLGEVHGDDQTTRLMHADCRQREQRQRQTVQRQQNRCPQGLA